MHFGLAAVLSISCYIHAVQSVAATTGKISVGTDSHGAITQIIRKVGRHGHAALDSVKEEQATELYKSSPDTKSIADTKSSPETESSPDTQSTGTESGSTDTQSTGTEFCDNWYVFGVKNTNQCLNPKRELRITDEALCEEAMTELKMNKSDVLDFLVPSRDTPPFPHITKRRPKGCFKDACDIHDPDGPQCMYMNDYYGADSDNVKGTPICSMALLRNGTKDYWGGANGGCPTDYQVIMNETICQSAATCLGYTAGAGNFRISETNYSKYDDFPEGCFINSKTGFVHINFRPNAVKLPPLNPYGMPLCIIKTHHTTPKAPKI